MALDINNNNKTINDSPDNTDNATKKIRESVDLMHQQPQVEELSISSLDKKMQENSIDMQDDSQLVNKTTSPSSLLSAVVQSVHNQEAIEALLKRTGYPLRQENGQRKYGPPPNWDPSAPEPGRACEIFIGKIPRDCFEDEIVPLLERIGHLYEFRLMMEYSGYNRGYGFAMFTNREDAKKAVAELNNYEIRKGRMIGICSSVDNCRLFVGGIPKSKTKEEILEEMRKVTEDVVNVIVYPSAHDKTKNRGFAFVQYTNHRAAAIARRKLIPNRIQLFGQPIAVDWAEPEPEVDEDVMATVKVLYVRNLMLSTTEEQIKAEFEKIKEGMIERVKKMKDFAFVHFKEREDALRCMHIMNGATIDGAIVEVSLSKPVDKSAMTRLIRATPSPTSHLLTNAAAIMAVTTGNPSSASAPLITIPFPTMAALTAPIDTSATVPQTSNGGTNTPPTALTIQPATAFTPFQPQSLLTTVSSAANQTPQSYQVPAQFLTSSVSFPAELLTQATHSPQQPSSHLLVKGHRSSRGISSSRVGQGYKYYLKGVAGTVKKQASSQDIPYDLYSGMNPVPVLPFNPFQSYSNKSSNQILEEICLKEGFGMPSYTLHTTNGTDQDGREIGLYMYKITVPGLFQGKPVASNKLMRTIDEAKIDAADFLLSQICPQPAFIDLNEYYAAAATQTPTPTQPNTQLPLVYQAPADLVAHQHLQTQQQRNSIPSAPNSGPADGFYGSQASNPANPLIQPQYLVDATGQYIVCQPSLWQ